MSDTAKYSVCIELYTHDHPATPSPLLPPTPTRLPPDLDVRLRSQQDNLVLPSRGKGFWHTRLPATRKLDTRTAGTLSAIPPPSIPSPVLEGRSPPPQIWSESFGLYSPPSLPTAELWTPSKAAPSPASSASSPPAGRQQAVLDFRFGPLAIDWIINPEPRLMTPSNGVVSPQMAARALPGGLGRSPTLRGASLPQREPETSGTTDLYWGTIHLYREAGAEGNSSKEEKQRAKDEDDGKAVGLVSVPGVLNAAALLSFIAPALESVEQVRMLRDATPNRSLVLLRFRDAPSASEFKRVYDGRPYHDSKDSEVCHVVSLSSIKLKTTSTPPFTFPYSPSEIASHQAEGKELVELPTCPVCLEVLDSRVTGLVQIPCQHSYHCNCLLKWGDSRCPVCRSTNARARRNTASESTSSDSKCAVCSSPSNLWICVICGHVGCGRYQGGHAHSHFGETGHSYSLEIETGRIWSYFDDEYVHRLIRLRPDPSDPTSPSSNRLIELPSLSSASSSSRTHNDPDDLSAKIGAQQSQSQHHGGPDRTQEVEQDKLEALALEYGNLMSSQLGDQREYYEEELARLKDLKRLGEVKRDELDRELERVRKERVEVEKREKEKAAVWSKEKAELEFRVEALRKDLVREAEERKKERLDFAKTRKALEKDLEAERAVTKSLTTNLASLRTDFATQQNETNVVKGQVDELKDQLNDLMAALSMREQVERDPDSEWAGASIGVAPNPEVQQQQVPRNPSAAKAAARKKKQKAKK
ncbi:hypothetical protein JCM11641_005619 [Rhodosporidiobolus odoratus]